MKLGIMQPYFVPYLGYWQLLNAVDNYVIFDDVNYINRGWINRNRILVQGMPHFWTLPCLELSQNKKINEIKRSRDDKQMVRMLRTIEQNYKKAPYFSTIYPMMEHLLLCEELLLSKFLERSIRMICNYLGIETRLLVSSEIPQESGKKGQERILSLCKQLSATEYYNAIGGQSLYSFDRFETENIKLSFVKPELPAYPQLSKEFAPGLSIVDVLMMNSVEDVRQMLKQYHLITGGEIHAPK